MGAFDVMYIFQASNVIFFLELHGQFLSLHQSVDRWSNVAIP